MKNKILTIISLFLLFGILCLFLPITSRATSSNATLTFIGDSLTKNAYDEGALLKSLPNADVISPTVGRSVDQGIAVLQGLQPDQIGQVLVFALGTNGGITQSQIDTVISDALKGYPTRTIVFMTSHVPASNGNYGLIYGNGSDIGGNKRVLQAAKAHPGVVFVVDWDTTATALDKAGHLTSDGIHEADATADNAFADLFAETVQQAYAGTSNPPGNSGGSSSTSPGTSNCVFTKIGTLPNDYSPTIPPECGTSGASAPNAPANPVPNTSPSPSPTLSTILDYAKQINNALEFGQVYGGTYYNKMVANITNGSYSAHTHASDNASDSLTAYFCTDLVLDAYNLAGIQGLTESADLAVINMVDYWRKTSGYQYLDYYHTSNAAQKEALINSVQPGDAIFFEAVLDHYTGQEHTSIVSDIHIDSNGNGYVKTIDANAPQKTRTYVIDTGEIKNDYDTNAGCVNYDPAHPQDPNNVKLCKHVVGFGGLTNAIGKPISIK